MPTYFTEHGFCFRGRETAYMLESNACMARDDASEVLLLAPWDDGGWWLQEDGTEVLAAGYFDAAHGLLTTGDSILVSADDGEAIVRAAIVNGGAVVAVSQGGAGTANLGFAANELGLGTVERTLASDLRDLGVPVTRFGALGTAVELSDVVSTASSAVLTSPSGGFAFAEVGDLIEIDGIGAIATKYTSSVLRTATMGGPVSATIIAKASSTQVTISTNATTTASGCRCVYGPDEFDALARTRARTNGCVLAVEVTRVGNGVVMTNGFVEFDILELKRAA